MVFSPTYFACGVGNWFTNVYAQTFYFMDAGMVKDEVIRMIGYTASDVQVKCNERRMLDQQEAMKMIQRLNSLIMRGHHWCHWCR